MSTPAKVAWISCVGEKGGAEVTMLHTFRVMDRTRFQPVLVQLRPGPLSDELRELKVDNYVLKEHRMRNLPAVARTIWQVSRLAREHGFALLHSNGFRAHVYGGWAARLAGIPEVWTGHTVEVPGLSTRAILSIPTTQVIGNCPRTAQFYERAGKPTRMIWPGVNTAQLDQGTSRSELAQTYQLPETQRWVSMGARLQRFKGQREFVRAMASLPRATGVHGIVIGGSLFGQENDYERELRALAAELNVTDRITFTGFIPDADVAGLLGASCLTLHPAYEEDFGLAVAEAQALGVPTIAFATVGPAAIIEDGKTGWLVPIGDQSRLEQVLAQALANPEQLQQFGAAARERSRRLFVIEEHTRQTEEVYSQVLRNPSLSDRR